MVELLKQKQYSPMHVYDQVLSIYAGTQGHLDNVPISEVPVWEAAMVSYINTHHKDVRDSIASASKLTKEGDETTEKLEAALEAFKAQYSSAS